MNKSFTRRCIIAVSSLLLITSFSLSSALAADKVYTLKAVHFLPSFMDNSKEFIELLNRISANSNGRIKIDIKGGPEVFSPVQMGEYLRKGVIDCLLSPTEYYKQLLPEATVFHLGMLTPEEERESGFYDYMVKRHKEFGVYYVGRTRAADPFFVYLKKKITKPEDFTGLKIGRSAPLAAQLYRSFGATVVTVQAGDFYSALERGVIDGAGHPSDGITGLSLPEVAKYLLNEPVYVRNSTVFIMNLKKFESLPEDLQKIIQDTTIAWEKERVAIDKKRVADTVELARKKGMELLTFSPEDSKKFFDRALQVEWDIIKKEQPDQYEELRKLLKQD